jgi:LmbE family N-acetylglucosaminyl deacetylase
MDKLDIFSLTGHLLTAAAFIVIVIYLVLRRKVLFRTSQQTNRTFVSIVSISVILATLNIFRFIYEFNPTTESILTSNLDKVSENLGIFALSAMIIILYAQKIIVEPKVRPGRVLAIGAHPDDIEIAAGSSLARMRDRGYQVCGIIMTNGEKGGRASIRPTEARKGAQFLGLDEVDVHTFSDTRLTNDAVKMTQVIEEEINKTQPDIIFTHSIHDLHQDHQAVYEATLRAARNVRTTILCYESPSVTQDFHPTYFIDACGYVDVKIEAIRQHWDQRNKAYMKPDQVRSKLAFRGGQAKMEYAEGFEVARMVSAI